jgi:hypothetical protein
MHAAPTSVPNHAPQGDTRVVSYNEMKCLCNTIFDFVSINITHEFGCTSKMMTHQPMPSEDEPLPRKIQNQKNTVN